MNHSPSRPSKFSVFMYTLFSVLSAVFIIVVISFSPVLVLFPPFTASIRKPFVGMIYIGICTLGLVAAIFPSKCKSSKPLSAITDVTKPEKVVYDIEGTSYCGRVPIHHGHHPGCETFDSHEIIVGRKSICAGCFGLAVGAIISIGLTIIYFGNVWSLSPDLASKFVIFGTIGSMSMLGRYIFLPRSGSGIRTILHTLLVIGATVLLIGIDVIGQSLVIDYVTILLVLFWLRTKMLLTKWEHVSICSVCDHPCDASY